MFSSKKNKSKNEVLGVIPARGGSKGLPRKNIKELLGKPLIVWSIDEVKRSKLITRTIVLTDDEEIAEIAKKAGAEVPYIQPVEVSTDTSGDVEYLTYALDWLQKNENYTPDIILRLPPTSPLRTATHIDEGIKTLLENTEADASRPIVEVDKHPYKMWKIVEDGPYIEPFLSKDFTGMDEPYNKQRQLFPKVYSHTGAMDVICLATLVEQRSTSGKKLAYFFMKPEDSINIDSQMDFDIAELYLQKRLQNN